VPIIDESGTSSLQAVIAPSGKLAERVLYADAYGDAPRYLDGSGVELTASGFVFRDRVTDGVVTYVPGLARLDEGVLARFAASDSLAIDTMHSTTRPALR